MEDYPYQVINPAGRVVMTSASNCRYSRTQELLLLENGYTIKLNGKKLTKTELRKELGRK